MNAVQAEAVIRHALEGRPDEWRAEGTGEPSPAWIARVAVDALIHNQWTDIEVVA